MMSCSYGACPKNETCAFSEGLTHQCTGAGGVGYEKFLDWPPWKQPFSTRVAQNAQGVVKGINKGVTRASFGRRATLTP